MQSITNENAFEILIQYELVNILAVLSTESKISRGLKNMDKILKDVSDVKAGKISFS